MNYFKIGIEDIVVLYDDMDLPVGKIRLRQKGSAGGHNGVKSIISCLGSDQFNRIKIGVGRPAPGRSVVNHVLANFEKEEQEEILASVDKSVEALRDWIKGDNFIQTMNRYN
jgi:aminoacyl-tRNA hydrolase